MWQWCMLLMVLRGSHPPLFAIGDVGKLCGLPSPIFTKMLACKRRPIKEPNKSGTLPPSLKRGRRDMHKQRLCAKRLPTLAWLNKSVSQSGQKAPCPPPERCARRRDTAMAQRTQTSLPNRVLEKGAKIINAGSDEQIALIRCALNLMKSVTCVNKRTRFTCCGK